MFWIKYMIFITPSFLHYSPIHEIFLKLRSSLFLLKTHYCQLQQRFVLLWLGPPAGHGETSSLLLWLFSIFIARLLNVNCRKSPRSKDQSPDLSHGIPLPFNFHCPLFCFSKSKTILQYFFLPIFNILSESVQNLSVVLLPDQHVKNPIPEFQTWGLDKCLHVCLAPFAFLFQFCNSEKQIQNTDSWLFPVLKKISHQCSPKANPHGQKTMWL